MADSRNKETTPNDGRTNFEAIERYLILKPILDYISKGSLFPNLFYWGSRLFAVLVIFMIIRVSVKIWAMLPASAPFELFIAITIFQILILGIGYVIINILWFRGNDFRDLPDGDDYVITPIFVLFIRATAEIFSAFITTMGLSVGIFTLIAGSKYSGLLNQIPVGLPFAGIAGSGFIGGPVMGIFILLIGYWIAELVWVSVDIARNTKKSGR